MAETKSFDPAVLATLTTGTLLVEPFGLAHEAAEWVLGHPIWTHQFPKLLPKLREAIVAQFPSMPLRIAGFKGWQHCRDEVRARYGAAVEVAQGSGETAMAPLDLAGFPDGVALSLTQTEA